jgi:signal transduction histidine kinase
MVLVNRLTSFIQNEKLKLENHFFEMITATVSHDMRTPINAITGLISNLEHFITDPRG